MGCYDAQANISIIMQCIAFPSGTGIHFL